MKCRISKRLINIVILLFISITLLTTTVKSIKEESKINDFSFKENFTNKEQSTIQNLLNFANKMAQTNTLEVKNAYEVTDNSNINQESKEIVEGSILLNLEINSLSFIPEFLNPEDYKEKVNIKLIARARYAKTLSKIGWSKLFVETFNKASPEVLSYAAGYLEGKLSAKHILDFYKNLVGIHSDEKNELEEVFRYYSEVEKNIRKRTSKENLKNLSLLNNEKELRYWITVAMIQAQTDGLFHGYQSEMKGKADIDLKFEHFYFINADGEVPELLTLFKLKKETFTDNLRESSIDTKFSFKESNLRKENQNYKFSREYLKKYFGESDPELLWQKLMSKSHCSALIKPIINDGKLEDIYVSHTTWDSFSEMHRIMKIYDFRYSLFEENKRSKIMFSSYPGTLTSTDDFYLLNNQINVLETTLEILDKDLYLNHSANSENHVPNYIRISVANRLAKSGKEWADIFKENNSGTYNSQWMIIDYKILDSVAENELFKSVQNKQYKLSEKTKNDSHIKDKNDIEPLIQTSFPAYASNNPKSQLFKNANSNKSNSDLTIPTIINNSNYNDLSLNSNDYSIYNPSFYSFKSKNKLKKKNVYQKNPNFYLKVLEASVVESLKDFLIVLEQIPGNIKIEDKTKFLLDQGYWASYNRPFYPETYKKSGYSEMMKKYGQTYSYYDNPRAQIFNEKITSIKTKEDLKQIMQSTKDINGNLSVNSISPRFDLSPDFRIRKSSGGIDTKISSYKMIYNDEIEAISGPAYKDNGRPFNWSEFPNDPHYGLPQIWNFDWITFNYNIIKNKE